MHPLISSPCILGAPHQYLLAVLGWGDPGRSQEGPITSQSCWCIGKVGGTVELVRAEHGRCSTQQQSSVPRLERAVIFLHGPKGGGRVKPRAGAVLPCKP